METVAEIPRPKTDCIILQSTIREQIKQSTGEWKELKEIYKRETGKKKSKFSDDELDVLQEFVRSLHAEIEKVKNAQVQAYAKGRTPEVVVATWNMKAISLESSK